ncbi:MAG: hypothetical protein MUQ00_11340, partial [Candidatus Aminicenantes bacterium]|nr:hypothetical protein [Candidatus Aminicenantes bacterium]
ARDPAQGAGNRLCPHCHEAGGRASGREISRVAAVGREMHPGRMAYEAAGDWKPALEELRKRNLITSR